VNECLLWPSFCCKKNTLWWSRKCQKHSTFPTKKNDWTPQNIKKTHRSPTYEFNAQIQSHSASGAMQFFPHPNLVITDPYRVWRCWTQSHFAVEDVEGAYYQEKNHRPDILTQPRIGRRRHREGHVSPSHRDYWNRCCDAFCLGVQLPPKFWRDKHQQLINGGNK